MCDQIDDVLFKSKNCQIKSIGTREIVGEAIRTKNNVYVLKEKKNKCCLGRFGEIWLWHQRLGHLNFDQFVK